MWAAAEGHVEVVDALLKAGADFRTPLASGFTPLFFAVREGRTRRGLPAAGGRRRCQRNDAARAATATLAEGQPTPLILAVENGHFELAVALLKAGADPNDRPAGFTALHAITWVRKPIRGDGDPPPQRLGKPEQPGFRPAARRARGRLNARLEKGNVRAGQVHDHGFDAVSAGRAELRCAADAAVARAGRRSEAAERRQLPPLLAAAGVGALGDGDEAAGRKRKRWKRLDCCSNSAPTSTPWTTTAKRPCTARRTRAAAKLVQLLADHGADINVWNRKNKWGWTPLMIAQGHRPGNFRPAPDTIAAIENGHARQRRRAAQSRFRTTTARTISRAQVYSVTEISNASYGSDSLTFATSSSLLSSRSRYADDEGSRSEFLRLLAEQGEEPAFLRRARVADDALNRLIQHCETNLNSVVRQVAQAIFGYSRRENPAAYWFKLSNFLRDETASEDLEVWHQEWAEERGPAAIYLRNFVRRFPSPAPRGRPLPERGWVSRWHDIEELKRALHHYFGNPPESIIRRFNHVVQQEHRLDGGQVVAIILFGETVPFIVGVHGPHWSFLLEHALAWRSARPRRTALADRCGHARPAVPSGCGRRWPMD